MPYSPRKIDTSKLLLWIHFSILNCWVALSHHFAPVPSNTARRIRLPAAASWLHWKVNQKCRTQSGASGQLQEVFFGDFRREHLWESSSLFHGFPIQFNLGISMDFGWKTHIIWKDSFRQHLEDFSIPRWGEIFWKESRRQLSSPCQPRRVSTPIGWKSASARKNFPHWAVAKVLG
jgi:hypothetical protein